MAGEDKKVVVLRNSLAPNDGYCPRSRQTVAKRSNSVRNSTVMSGEQFNKFAHGMMRHMRNPQPSGLDILMYKFWRISRVYLPLAGGVSKYNLDSPYLHFVTLFRHFYIHHLPS